MIFHCSPLPQQDLTARPGTRVPSHMPTIPPWDSFEPSKGSIYLVTVFPLSNTIPVVEDIQYQALWQIVLKICQQDISLLFRRLI